ncbi:hypothetical protein PMAC_000651 [Pneumocystis sp. 'macacae']|nr:hypothetical protein PMAC_000651 [Pneumocystis sp. 'macacae']
MNEDTEWNDLLRVHGILPPLPTKIDSDDDDKNDTANGPVELSPDSEWEDLEDDRVVQAYMQQRRDEIKAYVARAKYGEILPIQRAEWATEVNEASKTAPVLVFLYKDAILASQHLSRILVQLANEYLHIKIVKIQGDQAIEGYPDKNLPTLLVYREGDLVGQKISVSLDTKIEEWLIGMGVIERREVNKCRRLRIHKTESRDDIYESEEL